LTDLQGWLIKNHHSVWNEWLLIGPHEFEFTLEEWVKFEHFEIYEEFHSAVNCGDTMLRGDK